jgi:hypothetical protein
MSLSSIKRLPWRSAEQTAKRAEAHFQWTLQQSQKFTQLSVDFKRASGVDCRSQGIDVFC